MDRNFRVGKDYQVVDVVGEGAYGMPLLLELEYCY